MKKSITIGMDLGDKKNAVCVLDKEGVVKEDKEVSNTEASIKKFIGRYPGNKVTVAIEMGTHSPWVSRLLEKEGCEVLVGNARKLRMIWKSNNKSDRRDAEMLARIARYDRKLLCPIHHRNERCHADLAIIKSRDVLVRIRSKLINYMRSTVKTFGGRIPACSSESFSKKAGIYLPEVLKAALVPLIEEIQRLSEQIKRYDWKIRELNKEGYPETAKLMQIQGVGPVTALGYVLTIEEAKRFKDSRTAGAFLGMTPKRDQSGKIDKQLRITKAGNRYLRQLLVGCAHYILGPFGCDSDLRRHGIKIMSRGGKNAKKRAVVAVARKLSVLMHCLWKKDAEYDPLYVANKKHLRKAA